MRTLALVVFSLSVPGPGWTSPWTLPAGQLAVVGRYDFDIADEEFLDDNERQVFPLRGEYQSSTYALGLRFGITDRFELGFEVPIKQVTYTSDPVILLPTTADEDASFDYYQDNVVDLSQARTGLGDLRFSARLRLFEGPFTGALELGLKTPTGYDAPEGTFGDRPTDRADFLARADTLISPENVTDDVTLGDGQLDLTPALLLGWAGAAGTFVRLDLGYMIRFEDAGDAVVGAFKVGQLLGGRVVVFTGLEGEYTVTEGRVIGISVAAEDPTLPAADYGGTRNLDLREVTLDRDRLVLPVGAIVRLTSEVELNVGYRNTLWGRNTAATQGVSVGIGLRTQLL